MSTVLCSIGAKRVAAYDWRRKKSWEARETTTSIRPLCQRLSAVSRIVLVLSHRHDYCLKMLPSEQKVKIAAQLVFRCVLLFFISCPLENCHCPLSLSPRDANVPHRREISSLESARLSRRRRYIVSPARTRACLSGEREKVEFTSVTRVLS